MYEIEAIHCDAAIRAVLRANIMLLDATPAEALETRETYGKPDTLGLDVIPEISIAASLRDFDSRAVLVTEEAEPPDLKPFFSLTGDVQHQPTVYVSDPTDRSFQLEQFLRRQDPTTRIGDIVASTEAINGWEEAFGKPASITGAFSAVTCLRFGVPICSVLLNFITQQLFVACKIGVFMYDLPPCAELDLRSITLQLLSSKNRVLHFRRFGASPSDVRHMKNFVTFLDTELYKRNFKGSYILSDVDNSLSDYLLYTSPGGPSRPLYLSSIGPDDPPIGFILANGEKIIEWIHWLPFLRFGRAQGAPQDQALALYEIAEERPLTRDGVLMSTSRPYSLFKQVDVSPSGGELVVVNIDRFRDFLYPSRIRSTMVLAPLSNAWVSAVLEGQRHRRIEFLRL